MGLEKEEHADRRILGLPRFREEAQCSVDQASPLPGGCDPQSTRSGGTTCDLEHGWGAVGSRPTSWAGARRLHGLRGAGGRDLDVPGSLIHRLPLSHSSNSWPPLVLSQASPNDLSLGTVHGEGRPLGRCPGVLYNPRRPCFFGVFRLVCGVKGGAGEWERGALATCFR